MVEPTPSARTLRRTVAELAQSYREGRLPYEQFLRLLPGNADREDAAIAALLDLIVEASSRTGQASEDESELWRLIDQQIGELTGQPAPADARS